MKKNGKELGGFMSGVLVLSISTFVVKVLGLAYKIPMINILGAEGMGYFNSAYEIFALLCVIVTAGLPVALSMMVSARFARRDLYSAKRVYKVALLMFLLFGAFGTVLISVFSRSIAGYVENELAFASIIAISPALLFVCASSAVRGYYQGLGKMMPTAISQLIEVVCKLILGIAFAYYALNKGYGIPVASAYAIVGLVIGTLLSALYLFAYKAIDSRRQKVVCDVEEKGISRRLLSIAFPITVGSAVLSLSKIVDMTLIMKRLSDIGYSSAGANEIYGSYTTLAVPVFSLVPSLVTPIALSLVPELCHAVESKDRAAEMSVVSMSMRLTSLFALPASIGIAVYSKQILAFLFPAQSVAVDIAAPLLRVLAVSILFSCMITTTNAILQAYSRVQKPIISVSIGTLVKAVSAYILMGIPSVGVLGAPISTLLCDVTVTAINLYYVNKYSRGLDGVKRLYLMPLLASSAMITVSFAVFLLGVYFGMAESISLILALFSAVASYFFFSFVFGAIDKDEILAMPFGKKLYAVMGILMARSVK